ncbi:MAG: hypothetical protein Q9165_008453 [Trypethelium subeluteriae]
MAGILKIVLAPLREIRLSRMSFSVHLDHVIDLSLSDWHIKEEYATSLTESENAAYIEVTEEITKVVQGTAPIVVAPALTRLTDLVFLFCLHLKTDFSESGASRLDKEYRKYVLQGYHGDIEAVLLHWENTSAMWDDPECWETAHRPTQGLGNAKFDAWYAKSEILFTEMKPIVEELRATIKEQKADSMSGTKAAGKRSDGSSG